MRIAIRAAYNDIFGADTRTESANGLEGERAGRIEAKRSIQTKRRPENPKTETEKTGKTKTHKAGTVERGATNFVRELSRETGRVEVERGWVS